MGLNYGWHQVPFMPSRIGLKEQGRWFYEEHCLLFKLKDLNLNLRIHCFVFLKEDVGDCRLPARFSERPCLRGVRWRGIEQDT